MITLHCGRGKTMYLMELIEFCRDNGDNILVTYDGKNAAALSGIPTMRAAEWITYWDMNGIIPRIGVNRREIALPLAS